MTIVGTYLVHLIEKFNDDGTVAFPFGQRPSGMLLYAPDGAMAAVVGRSDQAALEMDLLAGSVKASDRDLATAFRSAYGFAGTFVVEGDIVRHRILVSTVPNWVGTDQVRPYAVEGDMLTLRPPGWRVVARRSDLPLPGVSRS
jgi:Lipocalin-like domain